MHHLPDPALTLTIPSIHDGTVLDCRIYHPLGLETSLSSAGASASSWRPKNAAIIAHPYAPLGGSYDDPIVDEVAGYLLAREFIVGTFNFRGAGHSVGRTSWTAKPERDDYTSFVGFLVYYIHHLDPPPPDMTQSPPPLLLMGGYSYGAMITTQLLPLPALLAPFASPVAASDAAHIRLRAETLASQQRDLLLLSSSALLGARGRRSLRVGEGSGVSSAGRKSHDSRRSFSIDDAEEKLRKGVQDFLARTRHLSPGGSRSRNRGFSAPVSPSPVNIPSGAASPPAAAAAPATLPPIEGLVRPRPAYILVSPLQGIITNLATMSRSLAGVDPSAEAKLRQNPTLAVYGNQDVFVSAGKLRDWTARMMESETRRDGDAKKRASMEREGRVSRFEGKEIDGAGHFWVEEGVLMQMMGWVDQFVRGLMREA